MYRKALKYCSRKEETTSGLSRLSKVCNIYVIYAVSCLPRNCFFDLNLRGTGNGVDKNDPDIDFALILRGFEAFLFFAFGFGAGPERLTLGTVDIRSQIQQELQ